MERDKFSDFILASIKIHGIFRYNYSKVQFEFLQEKVEIGCNYCGETFIQAACSHVTGRNCPKCKNQRSTQHTRKTKAQFVKEFEEIHGTKYDLTKFQYINNQTKSKLSCKKCGETFDKSPASLVFHKQFLCECGLIKRPVTNKKVVTDANSYEQECKKKYGDRYTYFQDYKNQATPIKLKCNECQKVFEVNPKQHKLKGQGCRDCKVKEMKQKMRKTTEQFVQEAKEIHGDTYDYTETKYTKNTEKLEIKCNRCQQKFLQHPGEHLRGSGCYNCGQLQSGQSQRIPKEQIFERLQKFQKNKFIYNLDNYENTTSKIEITCKKCHMVFYQTIHCHEKIKGCIFCSRKNQYSQVSLQWLKEIQEKLGYEIQTYISKGGEFKIPQTRYRADGYDKRTNTIYEFHGSMYHGHPKYYDQHKSPFFNKNITYGELYEKTLQREQKIKELGYNLIVMWEHDYSDTYKQAKLIQNEN